VVDDVPLRQVGDVHGLVDAHHAILRAGRQLEADVARRELDVLHGTARALAEHRLLDPPLDVLQLY
jgi:hypothetical protein